MSSGTVFVVDDDESVRDSISIMLDSVGVENRAYESALDFLEHYDADEHCCLVLDIRMPGISGLELQDTLNGRGLEVPIVFITGHGDIPMAVEAMRKGAVHFIRKPFREQELLDAINEALQLDSASRSADEERAAVRELVSELTPREHEVFELVCDGKANKVIAIDLGISERTVEIHRSQVMHKTESRSLADLVRLKIRLENEGV